MGVIRIATEALALDVDRDQHALAAEGVGRLSDEARVVVGGGIDYDFFHPALEESLHVLEVANASPVADGHETLAGELLDVVELRPLLPGRGLDVQDHELVDGLVVEESNDVDGIAEVLRVRELDGLHEAATA